MKGIIILLFFMASCVPDYDLKEQLVGPTWQMTGMNVNGTPYYHSCGYSRARKIFQEDQVIIYPLCEYQDSEVMPYTLEGDVVSFDGKDYVIKSLSRDGLTLQYTNYLGDVTTHFYRAL